MITDLYGWLLDVYPGRGGAFVWLLGEDGERYGLQAEFPVSFFAAGPEHRLAQLRERLERRGFPGVSTAYDRRRELFSGEISGLAIRVADPAKQPGVFYWAKRIFPDLDYYDADVTLAMRYTGLHQVYPLSYVHVRLKPPDTIVGIAPVATGVDLADETPPLRLMTIEPNIDPDYLTPDIVLIASGGKSRRLSLRDPVLFVRRLRQAIAGYDPDVILTRWGDTWLFPQVLDWAEEYNLPFNPNRDTDKEIQRRKSFSYHSYGRILHRGQQVYLFGRWHIDQTNAVMYGDYELLGVLEQAHITGLPVQETARKSPGAGITAMQIIQAQREGILVPYHKQQVEDFKTPTQLIRADRGGLVGQPQSGMHHWVAGIDFFSMYPQIMAHFNVSPETMGQETAKTIPVPGLGVKIDQTAPGLIGNTLKPLLERRFAIKQRLQELHPLDFRYAGLQARAGALKWLLVVCFGYLGHKHFRWMKIEAHEAVTAFGREVLLQAKETAESLGFRVLYFNVDGLYVQKQGANQPEDFDHLLKQIEARTGLPIALDGIFRWITFLPSRMNEAVPVANRFYGILQDGKIKVRGLEMRRHDTPPLVYQAQEHILHLLAGLDESRPPEDALPEALTLLRGLVERLRAGTVPLEDLLVTQRLSRELHEYKRPTPLSTAVSQLEALGKPVRPGQVVKFLYTRGKPGVLAWRAGQPLSVEGVAVDKYIQLIARAASNVLQPFRATERGLMDLLGASGQLPLGVGLNTLLAQVDYGIEEVGGLVVEEEEADIWQLVEPPPFKLMNSPGITNLPRTAVEERD
jgi:DNA polymerase-2